MTKDDFLISKLQIVHGACGLVPEHLDGAVVSNQYAVLHPTKLVDLHFLKFLSHLNYFQQTCFHSSAGVHVEKMIFKLDWWFKWDIDIPSFREQRKIVEVISLWERSIAIVEGQIKLAKKLRSGLMNDLVFGKRKVPGFAEPWVTCSIGSILKQAKRPIVWNDDDIYSLISVKRGFGGLVLRKKAQGKDIKTKKMNVAREGDFLISKMQVLHGATGLVDKVFDGMHVSDSYISLVVKDEEKVDIKFFNWLAKTKAMSHKAYISSHGVHIEKMTFNLSLYLNETVSIPTDIKEQSFISKVLDEQDRNISILEEKLALLRAQRKRLLQALLGGEYRISSGL